jgi:hypothetical protein
MLERFGDLVVFVPHQFKLKVHHEDYCCPCCAFWIGFRKFNKYACPEAILEDVLLPQAVSPI